MHNQVLSSKRAVCAFDEPSDGFQKRLNITSYDNKKKSKHERRNLKRKRSPIEIKNSKTESVRFSCFASEVSDCFFSVSLSKSQNEREALKLRIFSILAAFCPPPKTAPCALNSKFKSLCIKRPAGKQTHRNRDLSRLISRNVKCLLLPYMAFASPSLLLLANISSRQANAVAEAHQQKTKYFHYVLQNITHSVFAASTNSRNVVKCRFRPGCEFWHRRISSQPSSLRNRCRRSGMFCFCRAFLYLDNKNRCCFCFFLFFSGSFDGCTFG